MSQLPASFFNRSPLLVAPDLLGKVLFRKLGTAVLTGRIVETEAYLATDDAASHSFIGKTKKNASMFAGPGTVYVYQIHRYHCLNFVTEAENVPSAVLIRAVEPLTEINLMKKFRSKQLETELTSGPGKLAQAFNIQKDIDGSCATDQGSALYVVDDGSVRADFSTSGRIGVSKDRDKKYRFFIPNSPFLSRK